ncbi:M23 family metallopeptidase [Cohnella endophytica]|uniref:M23 family metallopeptidase n=1 Tax=Cohnella endophytica TaxID=2419778 RepID=A0A494XFK2_9BACL|nr:M23 family metallopeptidase [Cohnella endophytica]RKP47286.1 M23 family metallopeptidase [Cohnella endophytica]
MNDGNKTPRKIEESHKVAGTSHAARPSGFKKLLSKRWVFPAAYMAAAAIIVTILWLNSGTGQKDPKAAVPGLTGVENEATANGKASPDAAAVSTNGETLKWPVSKIEDMTTPIPFYDATASLEDREAAMVEYDQSFKPHMATDFARKDAATFDVLAALSGKVTVADQTPTNGYEVQIEHPNGLVTVYQSLTDLKVQVGDEVKQGAKIATSGTSELEPSEGAHVHFEVRNNGISVNPNTLIKSAK